MMNLLANNLIHAKKYFTSDYHQSRNQFLQRVNGSDQTKSWQLDIEFGKDLFVDSLWLGPTNATKVLVFISATHGVEGYCGSACQSFLLDQLNTVGALMPEDLAILFVHSLNPWGMYWARRCDQTGIDLNRNFIDFNALPGTSDRVLEWLSILETVDEKQRLLAIECFRAKLGQRKFEAVISEGQYHTQWAPFFGGQQPSFANRTINKIINHYQLKGKELVVIDIHSGLGPYGFGELISDHPLDSAGSRFAEKLFGDAIAATAKGESFSAPKKGLMDYRWHQLMSELGCYITLEFGTYNTDKLFLTLLNEHRYWASHDKIAMNDKGYLEHRKAMLQQFCPDDQLWQQAVLFKVWQVAARVINYYQ